MDTMLGPQSIRSVLIFGNTSCMGGTMETFADVIDRWPDLPDFARDIGVAYVTAQQMRARRSIHSRHWLAVVEAATRRGYRDITYEALARIAAHGGGARLACSAVACAS